MATDALSYLGVLDAGGTPSATEIAQALRTANDMLDNMSSEELMVPALSLETFALTAGVNSYTIGAALTWNTARPMAIEAAVHNVAVYTASLTAPVRVVNGAEWASIPNRDQSSPLIEALFYDRATANAKVYVSPIPVGGTIQLTLWKALTQFADATTTITFPPGYLQPLTYSLAMALRPCSSSQRCAGEEHDDAMARIRNLNAALLGRKPPAGQTESRHRAPVLDSDQLNEHQSYAPTNSPTRLSVLRAGRGARRRTADELIDAWLTDQYVYAYVPNQYTLNGTQITYTIGPSGADFTAPRPTGIQDANIILNNTSPVVRQPVSIINVDQWASIRVQQLQPAIPLVL
jgi:hypothetical protein